MLNWEFLLQKKGDDSWLPLEATSSEISVEILEGFYRLAARSSLREAPVTVQLQYFPFDSNHLPNQSSLIKNANQDGLLIVFAYTHLTPGIWQVACALGNSSLAKLQFDVLPLSFETGGFEPEPEIDVRLSDRLSDQLNSPPNREESNLQTQDIDSLEQSQFQSDRLQNELVEAEVESIPATSELLEVVETTFPSLEEAVALSDQTTNQVFGQVSQLLTAPAIASTQVLLQLDSLQFVVGEDQVLQISGVAQLPGELEVILNDPQEMRMVLKQKFSLNPDLSSDRSSYPFNLEIELPPQNGVLIGTVQLLLSADLELDPHNQVTYQAISVTFFPARADLVSDPLDQPIPPRSSQPRPINLPSFTQSSDQIKSFNLGLTSNSANLSPSENLFHSPLLPNLSSDRFLDKLQQFSEPTVTQSLQNHGSETQFTKAQSANESQLEAIYQDLDRLLEAPIASPTPSSPTALSRIESPVTSLSFSISQAQSSQPLKQSDSETNSEPQAQPKISPIQIISPLPRHQPLPQPKLQTESEELISGYPLAMIIELPVIASNLAVRLWAKDCQTRQIIDGPRWLMDFKMLSDRLQTTTQITIPLGTVEILFEAVTVEIQSQRESYKTKLILSVVPPNLNTGSDLSWLAE